MSANACPSISNPVVGHSIGETPCFDDQALAAFVAGELSRDDLFRVEEHLAFCEDCVDVVTFTVLGLTPEPPPIGAGRREPSLLMEGRFEVGDLIAKGGMARVYVGVDTHSGQRVAIKCVRQSALLDQPDCVVRLAREADLLSRFRHPNIVRLIAAFDEGGRQYLVLEHLAGGTLRDLLRDEKRLRPEHALRLALDLARALSHAHALGVLHRDLKPENVLLASDGSARLIDFGLASNAASTLTHPGAILGTLAYVSPECLGDDAPDQRADLWSLGIVLFEMLTGTRPFLGRTAGALLLAILQQPAPHLDDVLPGAPAGLVSLVARMLQKDASQRVGSAREICAELELLCQRSSPSLRGARRAADRSAAWCGRASSR